MKIRKSFAGIAAAGLAITGVAVATAPAANAFPTTTFTAYCDVSGISTSAALWNATQTVTLNGSAANGQTFNSPGTVAVSYTYSTGPNNGGPAVSAATAQATFEIINSSNVVVGTYPSNTGGPYAVAGGGAFPGATLTANVPVPGNGSGYTIRVKNVDFESGPPFGIAVNCGGNNGTPGPYASNNQTVAPIAIAPTTFNALGANAAVSTITGQRAGVTGYARAGDTVNVTGTNWTASTAIDSVTVGGASATNTLAVDGSGNITGAITVPAGAATGLGSIVIAQGSNTSNTSITILGTRTLTFTPANAGPGSNIAVSGSNWDPNASISVRGYTALPGPSNSFLGVTSTDPALAATTSASGTFAVSYALSDVNTIAFGAAELPPFGSPATDNAITGGFSVNQFTCTRQVGNLAATTCNTKQNIAATVTAGALTQTAAAYGAGYTSTSIPFGSITTAVTAGTLTANLNPITVADARGGSGTWSLTATMPALTDGAGGTIANSNLSTTAVSCASNATGSATGQSAGAAVQAFSGTVTLCSKDATADSAGGTSGGSYLVNAGLSLNIPAFQKAAAYTSTITVTLT